ncbi:probable G-protein coupled receptor 149 [Osmerus eperlanus]|uniref:probable G-protein coupled receptor 149 n=1 Tax=Osmerus eperlanus TaxID=29151 RepID=UPI002E0D23BA
MKMSSTHLNSPSPNKSNLFTATYERTDQLEVKRQVSLALFGLCLSIAAVTFVGGVYSLISLLRTTRKTSLSIIVASMSVDDLLSVIPLSLFMLHQWERAHERDTATICTLSGLLYVFQGLSSNMKACLIAVYTFYVTKRFGILQSLRRPLRVMWAIVGVWVFSLAVSVLPLCGLGSFTPASLGCFPESEGFYVPLLFSLYSFCFCGMVIFFVPLTYHLMCSREPHRTFYPSYFEIATGPSRDGSDPLCDLPSLSRESLNKSFGAYSELRPGSLGMGLELRGNVDTFTCTTPASVGGPRDGLPDSPVLFAQKRFSMILAVVRLFLWMPMMTLVLVRHAVNARSASLETLSFFLTLLAPAVTPVFVLSKRWIHLPCGCFINCRRDPAHETPAMKRRFEFNLSFQQGYGIYKISQATEYNNSPSVEKPSYHNLFNCNLSDNRLHVLDSAAVSSLQAQLDFRTLRAADSSSLNAELEPVNGSGEALADCLPFLHGNQDVDDRFCGVPSPPSLLSHHRDGEDHNLTDTSILNFLEPQL